MTTATADVSEILGVIKPMYAACSKYQAFLAKKEGIEFTTYLVEILQKLGDQCIMERFYRPMFGGQLDNLRTPKLSALLFSLKTSGYQNDVNPKRVEDLLLRNQTGFVRQVENKYLLAQIELLQVDTLNGVKQVVSGRNRTYAFAVMFYGALQSALDAKRISKQGYAKLLTLLLEQRVPTLSYDPQIEEWQDDVPFDYYRAMVPVWKNLTRTVSSSEEETALQAASGIIPGNLDSYLKKFSQRDESFGASQLFTNIFCDFASGYEYTQAGEYDGSNKWVPSELSYKFGQAKQRITMTRTSSSVALIKFADTIYRVLTEIGNPDRKYQTKYKGTVVEKEDQLYKPGLVGYELQYNKNVPKYEKNSTRPLHTRGIYHIVDCMFNYFGEDIDWSLSTNKADVLKMLDGKSWIQGVIYYLYFLAAKEDFILSRQKVAEIRQAVVTLSPTLYALLDKEEFYPATWFGTQRLEEVDEVPDTVVTEEDVDFDELLGVNLGDLDL